MTMNPNRPPEALDDARLRYEMLVLFLEAAEEASLGVDVIERATGLGADEAMARRVADSLVTDGLIAAGEEGAFRITRPGVNRVAAANRAGEDSIA